ncbi:Coenzyme F420 hydrogenase/dehydrogenase, beta subunit C-terminal domain [Phocaeicola faecalis]|uniref:Coenzyme F420 hydrogenase/dehydrogenase, beta subunit C-terminal domain n=1 Tax=Phocaeicola faecalis TaxID=2786956 RepID=UPI001F2BFD6B|nr:Coenzyme F420 hydrogenase/dehydrogenase, beta subunit C-terminal domain [Phocaeicola faecalis]
MIVIKDKSKCCGCSACAQRCPQQCILMYKDEEGFLYPKVNNSLCIGCGLCEKVCPILNQNEPRIIKNAYAAIHNDDEIRRQSSSGGFFTSLAEFIIERGGVVFGAKCDNHGTVIHTSVESKNDIYQLRGSKYVQSFIGNTFIEAKTFLDNGRLVLFSGTPCQISGLKLFLKASYINLYTLDIVCHGVPSPMVWNDYLRFLSLEKGFCDISKLHLHSNFRDKENGWRQYQINIWSEYDNIESTLCKEFAKDNIYMQGFLKNLFIRPSCFVCPAKKGKSNSDFTLGDFWGVEKECPELDDNKGISIVIAHTKEAIQLMGQLNIRYKKVDQTNLFKKRNVCYYKSTTKLKEQAVFWMKYKIIGIHAIPMFLLILKPSIFEVGILRLKQMVRKLL